MATGAPATNNTPAAIEAEMIRTDFRIFTATYLLVSVNRSDRRSLATSAG
jgi:hypothetical protein